MAAKKELITGNMTVSEVVLNYPTSVSILMAYGLHCFDCGGAEIETLEEGTVGHGMSQEELDLLLIDLNEEAQKQEKMKKEKKENKKK